MDSRTLRLVGVAALGLLLVRCASNGPPAESQETPDASASEEVVEASVDGSGEGETLDSSNPTEDAMVPEGEVVDEAPPYDLFAEPTLLQVDLFLTEEVVTTLAESGNATVEGGIAVADLELPAIKIEVQSASKDLKGLQGKAGFTLRFDGVHEDLTLGRLRAVRLSNMNRDQSMMREVLANHVFRSLGLPAPRTRYVRLRVNEEDRGLYLATEPLGEDLFVERCFGTLDGLMYETWGKHPLQEEELMDFKHTRGEDPDREQLYALITDLDAIDQRPGHVMSSLDKVIDFDRYLTYAATELLMGQKRGYVHGPQRYGLYLAPDSDRWQLIPMGLDRTFQDVLNPLQGKGRIQTMCLEQISCRLALKERVIQVAAQLADLDLVADILAAKPFIIEMATDDPWTQDAVAEVEAAIAQNLNYLGSAPGWLVANMACADPSDVDVDGDGWSGCGDDCDDDDAQVHPEAPELCNLFDDDCDGVWDNVEECPKCTPYTSTWGREFDLCFETLFWKDAEEACIAKGGHLASIGSEYHQQELKEATFSLWVTEWWIGLNDLEEEGVYVWSDGTPYGYSAWNDGEPNNSGDEDCTHFASWASGLWNDIPCDRNHAYVCEYP